MGCEPARILGGVPRKLSWTRLSDIQSAAVWPPKLCYATIHAEIPVHRSLGILPQSIERGHIRGLVSIAIPTSIVRYNSLGGGIVVFAEQVLGIQ